MKKDDFLSWALTFLYFGTVSLLRALHALPAKYAHYVFDMRNVPLVVGLIFLICNKNRHYGILLLVVAVFVRLQDIAKFTNQLSPYLWVGIFFALSIIFYFFLRGGKK